MSARADSYPVPRRRQLGSEGSRPRSRRSRASEQRCGDSRRGASSPRQSSSPTRVGRPCTSYWVERKPPRTGRLTARLQDPPSVRVRDPRSRWGRRRDDDRGSLRRFDRDVAEDCRALERVRVPARLERPSFDDSPPGPDGSAITVTSSSDSTTPPPRSPSRQAISPRPSARLPAQRT